MGDAGVGMQCTSFFLVLEETTQLPGYSVVIATAEGAGAPYIALYKYTIAPLSTIRGPRGVSVLSIAIFICIACLHSVVCV